MAKTNKTTASAVAPVVAAEPTRATINKSDSIRQWFAENPTGTAVQCQKALAEQGIVVGSSHCQQVKNNNSSKQKVDLDSIKLAASFVKSNGDVAKAIEAIDQVGDFITRCGSPAKAKAALEAYEAMAAALA
jgi:hypothetical protein